MEWAKLTKLGGKAVHASEADYSDYKGFLKCPECEDPVFLRKAHTRGEVNVAPAFVHHRAVPEVSTCELRVGRYSRADVEAINAVARGQRLQKLRISFWKMIKANLSISLKDWSRCVKDAKDDPFLGEVAAYGEDVWAGNQEFILDSTLPRVAELMRTRDERIGFVPEMRAVVEKFLTSRSRDWELHCQISKEALEFFLKASELKEMRHRLSCCLSHPTTLQFDPDLIDLNTATTEWRSKFVAFMTLYVAFVFLSVDWIEMFDQ